MQIDADEEEGGAVGVKVPDESTVVDVSANVADRREGCCDVRGVVYSEEKSCKDLNN